MKKLDAERFRDQMLFLVQSLQRMLESATHIVCDYGSKAREYGFKDVEPLCGQEITYYRSDGATYVINVIPAATEDNCEVFIVNTDSDNRSFVIRDEESEHEVFVEIHEYVRKLVQRFEQQKSAAEDNIHCLTTHE